MRSELRCVPSISVFRHIVAYTLTSNVDIVKDNVGGVTHEVIILGTVSQNKVADC